MGETMHEVTCFHCANSVQITPDDSLCMVCGEDLQHLLPIHAMVEYFRERSQELSTHGNLTGALAEVERGLTFAESSDLHLLAAILAQQLARPDKMREHVKAIPVDDSLRSEAEWLLRSHQDRERALREAQAASLRKRRAAANTPAGPRKGMSQAASTSILDDLLGRSDGHTAMARQGPALASLILVVLGMSIVVGAWWWFGPGSLRSPLPEQGEIESRAPDVMEDAAEERDNGSITQTGPMTPTTAATAPPAEELVQEDALLPTPTPSPTSAIPADLVQAQTTPGDRAENSPQQVVVIPADRFDIETYLREQGYSTLADLAIEASLQGSTLLLQGVVHLDAQRRQLVEVAQAIPGIENVSTTNLLLLPRATYVVQEGDTLWSVVYNIYGNVERLNAFYEANSDQLASPEALAPGMELAVPPVR